MTPITIANGVVVALEESVRWIFIALVHLYRWTLSPLKTALLGESAGCRFTPSCSLYALAALRQHGPVAGVFLTAGRICRCHPWGGQGYDPVPPSPIARRWRRRSGKICRRVADGSKPSLRY